MYYYYYCFIVFYRLGASIVVDTGTVLPVFARNLHNPLCFIQYPDCDVPPVQWEHIRTTYTVHQYTHCIVIPKNVQVSITFDGNTAITGSAIYANNLDLRSWYSVDSPYFYTIRSEILCWPFISYGYRKLNLN